MMNTGVIGACSEKIIRSDFFSSKVSNSQGFAATAVSGGFGQANTDGSGAKNLTLIGNLTNQFIIINGQLCEIVRFTHLLLDTQLTISCNSSDLSQSDISTVSTHLGTLNQSDVISFGVAGDASAGHRGASWSWRISSNGYSSCIVPLTTSTEASASNYRRSFLRVTL